MRESNHELGIQRLLFFLSLSSWRPVILGKFHDFASFPGEWHTLIDYVPPKSTFCPWLTRSSSSTNRQWGIWLIKARWSRATTSIPWLLLAHWQSFEMISGSWCPCFSKGDLSLSRGKSSCRWSLTKWLTFAWRVEGVPITAWIMKMAATTNDPSDLRWYKRYKKCNFRQTRHTTLDSRQINEKSFVCRSCINNRKIGLEAKGSDFGHSNRDRV